MRLSRIKLQPKFLVARGRVRNQEPDWGPVGNVDALGGPGISGLGFKDQGLEDTRHKY